MNKEENKVLGKSFDELLNDPSLNKKGNLIKDFETSNVILLPIEKIKSGSPEKNFSEQRIEELSVSIKEHGIINPLIVKYVNNEYRIIVGETRFRAAKKVGLKMLPVILEKLGDEELQERLLIDKLQRENLSPLEEAKTYLKMQEKHNLTQDELAKKTGKSRSYVANMIRLLKLPDEVKKYLEEEKISIGHVRALLGVEESKIIEVCNEIISKQYSVRETERIARNLKGTKNKKRSEINYRICSKHIKVYYKDEQQLNSILALLKVEKEDK